MANTKRKKEDKVNVRKYVNLILCLIAVVLVALIACKLYTTYKDNKLKESVFTRMGGNMQLDDIENMTMEFPEDGFVLISYVKNKDVKKLENGLKKSVVDNELQNNFYYLDATDLMLEDGYIESLNEKFKLDDDNKIEALPALLYYKEGKVMKVITSTNSNMMNVDDFNKLLDNYEIIDRN